MPSSKAGGSGEIALGCITGAIYGAGDTDTLESAWDGNDEWTRPA
jgi:hypothetical protein